MNESINQLTETEDELGLEETLIRQVCAMDLVNIEKKKSLTDG